MDHVVYYATLCSLAGFLETFLFILCFSQSRQEAFYADVIERDLETTFCNRRADNPHFAIAIFISLPST
jgi:hypothetical protein